MARLALVGAALLLFAFGLAAANDGCKDVITGYSGTFGKRLTGRLDRFNNQTAQWKAKGGITKVNAYYSYTTKCVHGLKMTYGWDAKDARLLGQERDLSERSIKLDVGEWINKVQIKAGSCVEYLRLSTNKGRSVEVGNAASATQTITSYPNKPTGFLAAIRGYEEFTRTPEGATVRGPLKTLQFVWGNCNAPTTVQIPKPAGTFTPAAPKPAPTPAPAPAPAPAAEPTTPAPAEKTVETPIDGPAEPDAPVSAAEAAGCPALLDQCSADASTTSAAFCPVLSPFKKATCMGGCCFSSGKCTSSSCAISGLGKEVPNTICYGLNPAIAIGASPNCRGLACKLAIPGCTSDLLGGSCTGTVVDLAGNAAKNNPAGAALVGYPCLDVTPSDKTLTAEGKLSLSGGYVAKLWSICDCKAPAAGAGGHEGLLGPLPKMGKLNMTDIKSLMNVLKPAAAGEGGAANPLQAVMDAVKSKIPPLVVPEHMNAVNLTNTLGFIGSLVAKANPEAAADGSGAVGAMLDLIKGASAVAAATNSTNPLGSLLGAFAAKGANGTNPLAGLGNLVTALSPEGADGIEKSDVLASILGALAKGTPAAPHAELLGAVGKVLAGVAKGESPAAGIQSLLSQFKPANGTAGDLVKGLLSAATAGKDAASGPIDLAGILSKAEQFVGKDAAGGNSSVGAILSGIKALADKGAAGNGSSPLAFLGNLANQAGAVGPDGKLSLQSIVDYAGKVGPVLQQLAGAGAAGGDAGANPLAGILGAIKGGEGGQGLDLASLSSLASKVGPVLQALGSGAGGAPGGDPLQAILGAVGLGEGGAGGAGTGQIGLKSILEAAHKAAPLLQALQKAGGGSNPNLAGLQAFIDKLAAPKAAAAA